MAPVPLSHHRTDRVLSPSELLLHSTVRIECERPDGGVSTGTGFFFEFARHENRCVPAIVTNKHVVRGAVQGAYHFHLGDADGQQSAGRFERFIVSDFAKGWIDHPDPQVDLCVLPAGPLIHNAHGMGRHVSFMPFTIGLIPTDEEFQRLSAFEEVLMIGYPIGLWDSVNNRPIVRRGITATHPAVNYLGKSEFLIDAACFPGSSGSPVVRYIAGGFSPRPGVFAVGSGVQLNLLGILHGGYEQSVTGEIKAVAIPTHQRQVAVSNIPINLGCVIRADALWHFEMLFQQQMMQTTSAVQPARTGG